MFIQTIEATWHRNSYSIVNPCFCVFLIVKLIQEIDIFGIQSGRSRLNNSEFIDFIAKSSAIMNTGMSLNNNKKRISRNWDQNKDVYNMFEINKDNANIEKNNDVKLDSDYNSDIIWKAIYPTVLSNCWIE